MAAPKKQRRVAQNEENSSDSDSNIENENNQEMEIVQVEFDVKFPESYDKQGIKNLLTQLFLKAHINLSELAEVLIEQNVTSVIKESEPDDMLINDDNDDVNFGVFSIVNLTAKKDMECVKQICTYLLNHCREVSSNENYENFKQIIEDSSKPVGLIISERFCNIPGKIAVPLYGNLREDINKDRQEAYNFAYYLLICKMVVFKSGTDRESINYINVEEELIAEEANLSFDFKVEKDFGLGGDWTDEDDEGLPVRRILVLPSSNWDSMYNRLVEELSTT